MLSAELSPELMVEVIPLIKLETVDFALLSLLLIVLGCFPIERKR